MRMWRKEMLCISQKQKMQGCWNWQTSRPQTPVFLTCGFKSRPLHQNNQGFLKGSLGCFCEVMWRETAPSVQRYYKSPLI